MLFNGTAHSFAAPPKTFPLLAYMLLHRHSAIPRESVASALWPDVPDDVARGNLRRHLHYLKGALPAGSWLVLNSKLIQWNPAAPYRLDVAEFEQQSRVDALRGFAVKLYTGDLLTNYLDEEWLFFERERLLNLQLANLTALIEQSEQRGDLPGALSCARTLLGLDPWREDAVRTVMRIRNATGDRSGALSEYERFRTRLDTEIGVEPMRETIQLFKEIGRSESPCAVPAKQRRVGSGSQGPFVGRDAEFDVLARQWKRAVGGHGALALVGGEAGIGKSRLLTALRVHVEAEGGLALVGTSSAHVEAPYFAIAQALHDSAVDLESLELSQTATAVLRSSLSLDDAHSLHKASAAGSDGDRSVLFAAIASAVRALAKRSPVLLCLEDLHWATADTIALLEFVGRRLSDCRALFVGSYRDEEVSRDHPIRNFRRAFLSSGNFEHIALNVLSREATAELLMQRVPEVSNDSLLDEIYGRSEGNPFFMTELLEHVASHGPGSVPNSIKGMVSRRFGSLREATRSLAQTVCVVGRNFSLETVAALTGEPEHKLQPYLDELTQARILRERPASLMPEYSFSHEIVRDALYEELSPEARRREHAKVCAALQSRLGSTQRHAGILAWHQERAGRTEEAAGSYVEAARYAYAVSANNEAESYARCAIRLADDPTTKLNAYLELNDLYERRADREAQRQVLREMERLTSRFPSLPRYEVTRRRLALAIATDALNEIPALTDRLSREIPDEPLWRARCKFFEGTYQFQCGSSDAAWTYAQDALALYREAGNAFGQLYSCIRLLELCDRQGRPFAQILADARDLAAKLDDDDSAYLLAFAEAKLHLQIDRTTTYHAALRMLEIGERCEDHLRSGVAHTFLAGIATFRFDISDARQHFAKAEEYIGKLGRSVDRIRLLRFRALHRYTLGDITGGLEDSLVAARMAREAEAHELLIITAGNAVYGYRCSGGFSAAVALVEETLDLFASKEIHLDDAHLRFCLGEVYAEIGEIKKAISHARYGYEKHSARGFRYSAGWMANSLAFMHVRLNQVTEARQYLGVYLAHQEGITDGGWMPQEPMWRAAQIFHALGEEDQALHLLTRAMDVVNTRLSTIPDDQTKTQYLRFSLNQRIVAAYTEGYWPPIPGDAASHAA